MGCGRSDSSILGAFSTIFSNKVLSGRKKSASLGNRLTNFLFLFWIAVSLFFALFFSPPGSFGSIGRKWVRGFLACVFFRGAWFYHPGFLGRFSCSGRGGGMGVVVWVELVVVVLGGFWLLLSFALV